MGRDKLKIRFLVFHHGRWIWRPTKRMRDEGFGRVRLGPGLLVDGKSVPAPGDIARAVELNTEWDRHRRGLPPTGPRLGYPLGSIGDAYHRATMMREKERQRKGITWTSEQRSRDDWPRAWKHIEFLADCDPKTVTGEMLLELRSDVAANVSESEAHRVIKVWRALWRKMAIFGFCQADCDPSLLFANSAPKPRQAVWREGEAVRLVKTAWRSGYRGLATLLAVGWDSQLSPVDARRLSAAQMRQDRLGVWFEVERAKTGRAALATLGKRSSEDPGGLPRWYARAANRCCADLPQPLRAALLQGHPRRRLPRRAHRRLRPGRSAAACRLSSVWINRGSRWRRGSSEAVGQNGELALDVEPPAQNLWPGHARFGARNRCCAGARPGPFARTRRGQKYPGAGPKVSAGGRGRC